MNGVKQFLGAVLLLLLLFTTDQALADTYRWLDEKGVTHFTDDPASIPERFRERAEKVETVDNELPTLPAEAERPSVTTVPTLDEGWWRNAYAQRRDEIRTLQGGMKSKQEQFNDLRRHYTIYHKPADRTKMNELQEKMTQDQTRIEQLEEELRQLDIQAAQQGVPLNWRQ
ncbi:MAG TPA: DUF4124 domain-containing protein, partial [Geobacterales bacterium]|nr:DUF4124 domain-containing protein [Geobacterales bacterium]